MPVFFFFFLSQLWWCLLWSLDKGDAFTQHKYFVGKYFESLCVFVTQLCQTLCDPMGCSPLSSFVHGILQAGILEWVSIHFSRESSQPRYWTWVSCTAGRFFYHLGHQGSPSHCQTFSLFLYKFICGLMEYYFTQWVIICYYHYSFLFSTHPWLASEHPVMLSFVFF